MSKQIHDGESDRQKQIRIRAPEKLVNQFDKSHDSDSRSEAIRRAMRRIIDGEVQESPLEPPVEDDLRQAYLVTVDLANHDGIVPHDVLCSQIASKLNIRKDVIERSVLGKLRSRGYLRQLTNQFGQGRVWKLRGYDR